MQRSDLLLPFAAPFAVPSITEFKPLIPSPNMDPLIAQGNGAFPFKTGISAVRMAISDIFDSYS
jgi:hypothetical protein